MIDYEDMWQKLGLDLHRHDELLNSITGAYNSMIGSQKNRPRGMAYFDRSVAVAHCHRVKELMTLKSRGKKAIGTFCIYVPEEIALAVGVIPIALCGGTQLSVPYAESLYPRDICPLIKSTLGLGLGKICPYLPTIDMAVGETTCDGKKKAWEILGTMIPMYVMEVPQKKGRIDRELWLQEVKLFKEKMEELSGRKVTLNNLRRCIRIINRKRQALGKLNEFRKQPLPPISGMDALLVTQVSLIDDPERLTDHVEVLCRELERRVKKDVRTFKMGTKRIMVSGCPTVVPNWKIHNIVETSGGAVVCDETCTGFRYYANTVEEGAPNLNALLDKIADRYLKINCSCFTPNEERVAEVLKLAKEYKADGVILYILQYCHGYNIEAIKVERALKGAGIPTLKLETDYSEEDFEPLRTRVEAFLETLGR